MTFSNIFAFLNSLKYYFIFDKFGKKSYIKKPIMLNLKKGRIFTGDKLRIQKGLRMEVLNHSAFIKIGENVSIGQNFHVISGGELTIADDVTVSGNVLVTNIDHDYTEIGVHILNQKHIVKETYIGENCFIGFGAAIQAGTKLGKQCIVGANSVVRGEFPDYCVIAGVPAKIIKKYNFKTKIWERVK